jgi:hypothetical protein
MPAQSGSATETHGRPVAAIAPLRDAPPAEETPMKRRHRRPHGIALGTALGGLIGAIGALVITLVGPGRTIWWTPAGFVAGIFGGLVMGFMFAEEVKGGEEDDLATAEAEAALHAQSEPNAATPE